AKRYPPLLLSPEQQRRKVLATLAAWLFGLARVQPVVLVVEDVHWVDPSTLELLGLFVVQGATAAVLLVYTARPEFRLPWRLGGAKEVAQVGAVIGRGFSYALLHAVSPFPEAELQAALVRLADAELLYPRGLPPEATYVFKHALVQDTAYASLLKSRRRELH